MIDCVVYISDIAKFRESVMGVSPDRISEEGKVEGVTSTPSVSDGVSSLSYVRLHDQRELDFWSEFEEVTFLGSAEYVGEGTSDAVYSFLDTDEAATKIYDSLYSRDPREVLVSGEIMTITPPKYFGIISGA